MEMLIGTAVLMFGVALVLNLLRKTFDVQKAILISNILSGGDAIVKLEPSDVDGLKLKLASLISKVTAG
ncbi:MAG: hypothetical protein A2939_03140 [Parcubacteria group bacterium RIFCSPLOWO2_01_FULL_48_18]|nr:MAG: hypothetical protein A2939_03140 [Parcubacteria group bacterium RIFCSPLOWO2_01_FULL_48_18]